jgi:2,4-dienoyl-CoA reductase-like NADH-dependent reductase (Old Yellow Enzyme family)
MTNGQSHGDGTLGDHELRWLSMRAEGGFGIIETCAAHVSLDGRGWDGELGIFSDRLLPGLTRLATHLSERGALPIVQLFHGGARSPRRLIGRTPLSASAIEGDPEAQRAATEADLARLITGFRDAALRAHKARFAGVEIHGAHGYLLCQFLSRTQNLRADAWGGALEGRARLLREVTQAIRAAVPASFLVGVRLSPEDFGNAKGLDLDESLAVAGWLADDGIDFLHLSLWEAFSKTAKRPLESAIPMFRKAIPHDTSLFVAGKVWTKAEANALLDQGADVVALGRSGIANPDWPARAVDPTWKPTRPPLTADQLADRGLAPTFIEYLRPWKGFLAS